MKIISAILAAFLLTAEGASAKKSAIKNTAPTISDIAAQSINPGSSTGALAFTISDAQTAASSLKLSARSSNTKLVSSSKIKFGGRGANRTVTVTPTRGQTGTTTIKVTVSDGRLSASDTFLLNVNANTAPTISDIAAQTINQGSSTSALAFTVGDAQAAAGFLNVSASSSNTTLVPTSNIVFGGSGANRTVTVTPTSGQTGTATITVTVSDGSLTRSDTFVLTVNANTAPTISDIAAQTINQGSSTSALAFTVGDAQTAAGSLNVSGSSSNTTLVPNANIVFGGSGSNRTVTVTPASNQSGTATITVTVSDGSLSTSDTFVLTVNSAPTISDITDQGTNADGSTAAIDFKVSDSQTAADSLSVSCSSSNTTLVPNANIIFGGNGANRTVTVTPTSGQTGTATITVTVSDGSLSTSDTFVLTVTGMVDLGVLPGYTNSSATGVSADASVVVGNSFNFSGEYMEHRAFRWTAEEGMVDLGLLSGYAHCGASDVSADGSVVVGEAFDDGGIRRAAFRWTAAEGMIDLGVLPSDDIPYSSYYASDVSADGSVVVGEAYDPISGENRRAFRWTAESGMVDLGVLPIHTDHTNTAATGVSANGKVVVGISGNQAFRWTAEEGMVDLGVFPSGGSPFYASSVSADGNVVVGFGSGQRAFRWTAEEGATELGVLPGYFSPNATGVSPDGGFIVGRCGVNNSYNNFSRGVACLWTSKGSMIDLGVLPSDDIPYSSYEAIDVSADGSVVVGGITTYSPTQYRAFRLFRPTHAPPH